MYYKRFPDWLDKFDLTVTNMDGSRLFDKYDDSLDDINFDDGDGFVVNSHIFIKDKEYVVSKMHVYCTKESNKMSLRLDVIVVEKAD